MSDTSGDSPPSPASDTSTTPPSSSDTSSSPPPQSDQGSSSSPPASTGDSPSSPPSPPPPDDTTPSLLPPLLPSPSESSPPPASPPPPPPANSNSSPPPAASPPPSTTTPSSPPPQSPPPSPATPPPTKSPPVSSPPPSRPKKSPPPPSSESSPPPPPPKAESPSPPSPDTSDQPPPPPSEFKPPPISPSANPSPSTPPAPTPPTNYTPPATPESSSSPPTSAPTTPSRSISPSGSDSSSDSSSSSSSSSSSGASESAIQPGTVAGVALAGVFLVSLIALYFVCSSRRRRRKRSEVYAAGHYLPASTISIKSEGYYPGQQHNMNFSNSGPTDGYYAPQTPSSFVANSYGSQRGVANPGGGLETGLMGGPNPYFSYEELMEITNGFSSQNVLGEGGFGCVYKGWLPDGKAIAVKQLKAGSGQGEREFKAEVEIISRVHHRHLVSLVGYCISERHRLLVYEFVPNKTLEHHLHGVGMPVLDWSKRLKIALGAAKGLAYLHEDCHPKIIHRDIKSANILLEDSFEAQVADFGLAKPSNDTYTHVSTRVMGTFGYMAPEYASSGKLTDRSDVYSFGVVLLELVTGRKPVDPTRPLGDESLVEWARPLLISALETGDLSELVDGRLGKQYVESEMMRMVEAAAACVRHSAPKRPRMVQVARALDCEGEMSDLSNGVKYGQSTIYNSGQYNQDIMKFRKMALGDSSEYDAYSGEFGNSREVSANQSSWKPGDGSSSESETRAFHARMGEQRYGGPQSNFGGRQS